MITCVYFFINCNQNRTHMPQCSVATHNMATVAMIYTGACVIYMILSQNAGTPFRDSLTETQLRIKKESARVRGTIFLQSLGIATMVVLCKHPFHL